jgi:hypothetical protein
MNIDDSVAKGKRRCHRHVHQSLVYDQIRARATQTTVPTQMSVARQEVTICPLHRPVESSSAFGAATGKWLEGRSNRDGAVTATADTDLN